MALMAKSAYLNLHVRDVEQSKAFFTGLGFEFNVQATIEGRSACIIIGDNMLVMLLEEQFFMSITNKQNIDTDKYAQLTIVLEFASREKVNEIVNTAASLGGKVVGEPEDFGFMYQWAFEDLDGHMWAISYMNMSLIGGQDQA